MATRPDRQPGSAETGAPQSSQSPTAGTAGATGGERETRATGARDVERNIAVGGEEVAHGRRERAQGLAGEGRGVARQRAFAAPLSAWDVARMNPWDLMRLGPWELMRRLSDDFDQLAAGYPTSSRSALMPGRGAAPAIGAQGGLSDAGSFVPQVEVLQRPNEVIVRADLPGLKPEDIEINVEDGILAISGERKAEHREERDGMVRTERSYGTFHRTLPLPDGADEENVAATFRNGVLEITVPVTNQRERGRKVNIKA